MKKSVSLEELERELEKYEKKSEELKAKIKLEKQIQDYNRRTAEFEEMINFMNTNKVSWICQDIMKENNQYLTIAEYIKNVMLSSKRGV